MARDILSGLAVAAFVAAVMVHGALNGAPVPIYP